MRKKISLYKRFIKKYCSDSLDNTYLIRIALLCSTKSQTVSAKIIFDAWTEFIKTDFYRSEIRFYNHIPFCHQRCSFCCYSSNELKSSGDLKNYVDNLIKHYRYFSPVFKDIEFSAIYFGGGTPSILTAQQMEKVFGELNNFFKFEEDRQKCIEFNPSSSSFEKLKVVKDFGFNKISFGVQSFDQDVLKVNGRGYQTEQAVVRAVSEAQEREIETINIDLLSGLYGDNEEKLINSINKALSLGPDSIHIYSVQPTAKYLENVCKMSEDEFREKKKTLLGAVSDKVIEIAQESGYFIAGLSKENPDIRERDLLYLIKRGSNPDKGVIPKKKGISSVFGVGPYSNSSVYKRMTYSTDEALEPDPEKSQYIVNFYDEKKDMLFSLYSGLAYSNSISLSGFKNNFDVDLFDQFEAPLNDLKKMKAFYIEGDRLRIDTKKIDWVTFFLFFVDESEIERAVKSPLPKIDPISH